MGKVRKKFDKKLYRENDRIARILSKEFLRFKFDVEAVDNPDKYGPDLLVLENSDLQHYVECEVKHSWDSEDFPFDSVQFPERKSKFIYLTKPTLFLMYNSDKTQVIMTSSLEMRRSPLIEVSNKFVNKGEYFYQIPLKSVKIFKLPTEVLNALRTDEI